jgi:hemoglobin
MATLFDKYGGFQTFSKIVHEFYRRVLDTPSLAERFRGVDMPRLIQHQTDFLSLALGSSVQYKGRSLAEAHRPLRITPAEFSLVAEILQETLEDSGVSKEDVVTIINLIGSLQDQIIIGAA